MAHKFSEQLDAYLHFHARLVEMLSDGRAVIHGDWVFTLKHNRNGDPGVAIHPYVFSLDVDAEREREQEEFLAGLVETA